MTENKHEEVDNIIQSKQDVFKRGLYEKFPAFKCEEVLNDRGYQFLAEIITKNIDEGLRILAIDGYHGVDWQKFRDNLQTNLSENNIDSDWIESSTCFVSEENLEKLAKPFLGGDDRIFGKHIYTIGYINNISHSNCSMTRRCVL